MCHVMSRYVVPCNVMTCNAMLYCSILRCAELRTSVPIHAMLRYDVLCCMRCDIVYQAMICYDMR